jgi:hypothetical protein
VFNLLFNALFNCRFNYFASLFGKTPSRIFTSLLEEHQARALFSVRASLPAANLAE